MFKVAFCSFGFSLKKKGISGGIMPVFIRERDGFQWLMLPVVKDSQISFQALLFVLKIINHIFLTCSLSS